jgi:hypothetical protein
LKTCFFSSFSDFNKSEDVKYNFKKIKKEKMMRKCHMRRVAVAKTCRVGWKFHRLSK